MDIEEVFITTMIGLIATIILSFFGYLAYILIREVGLWTLVIPAFLVVSYLVGKLIVKFFNWMDRR